MSPNFGRKLPPEAKRAPIKQGYFAYRKPVARNNALLLKVQMPQLPP
jgi:hypothetical protein